jgi:hypothetical protein
VLHTIHASLPKSGERPYRDVTLDPEQARFTQQLLDKPKHTARRCSC